MDLTEILNQTENADNLQNQFAPFREKEQEISEEEEDLSNSTDDDDPTWDAREKKISKKKGEKTKSKDQKESSKGNEADSNKINGGEEDQGNPPLKLTIRLFAKREEEEKKKQEEIQKKVEKRRQLQEERKRKQEEKKKEMELKKMEKLKSKPVTPSKDPDIAPVPTATIQPESISYCVCGQGFETPFMICCDICELWCHGPCVSLEEKQAEEIEEYHCPRCQPIHGDSILKNQRKSTRKRKNIDYSELEEGLNPVPVERRVATNFLNILREKQFANGDVVCYLKGEEFDLDFVKQSGLRYPLKMLSNEGLGMMTPAPTITPAEIRDLVGGERIIDIMDVTKQSEVLPPWSLSNWVDYFSNKKRNKLYNLISLEVSNTKLDEQIISPWTVRQIDWVDNIWPKEELHWPKVKHYCLMGVSGAYTDFHLDFGGSSVWYHVVFGKKLFLFVPPTEENLEAFKKWSTSMNQSEVFFGDKVSKCYLCPVEAGQTLIIPTGWIHAVYTPVDSLVFGGNFLHSFNIKLQLEICKIEEETQVPDKFRFPYFYQINWYAAKAFVAHLKEPKEKRGPLTRWEYEGILAMITSLDSWLASPSMQSLVPESISDPKGLLEELSNLILQEEEPTEAIDQTPWKEIINQNVQNNRTAIKEDILKALIQQPPPKKTKSEPIPKSAPLVPKVAPPTPPSPGDLPKHDEDYEDQNDLFDSEPEEIPKAKKPKPKTTKPRPETPISKPKTEEKAKAPTKKKTESVRQRIAKKLGVRGRF